MDPRGTVGRIYKETFIHSFPQNRKSLGIVVLEKNIFYVLPIVRLWELMTHGTGPLFTQGAWLAGFIRGSLHIAIHKI